MTLMVPAHELDDTAPVAAAFDGQPHGHIIKIVVSGGATIGLTAGVIVSIMAQARIWFALARDGLVLEWFGRVHPTFQTPFNATCVTVFAACFMGGLVPFGVLADMISCGTLTALTLVCVALLVLRYGGPTGQLSFIIGYVVLATTAMYVPTPVNFVLGGGAASVGAGLMFIPDQSKNDGEDVFRVPFGPVLPCCGIAFNMYLMSFLASSWTWIGCWLLVGLASYFGYGMWNSRCQPEGQALRP
mmetsp:Transcript_91548/g.245237  ORF Transcript_91548/g.245237 Transcript_91548/m.245237 type:complete len:244 (-) Transcript_91548:58-789(-)